MSFKNNRCRVCGSNATVILSSIDKYICNNCKRYSKWPLKKGKSSVLIEGKKADDS